MKTTGWGTLGFIDGNGTSRGFHDGTGFGSGYGDAEGGGKRLSKWRRGANGFGGGAGYGDVEGDGNGAAAIAAHTTGCIILINPCVDNLKACVVYAQLFGGE